MQNNIIRMLLLAIGCIIIVISVYYMINYMRKSNQSNQSNQINQSNQLEHFATYQALYTGDPIANVFNNNINNNSNSINGIICAATNASSNQLTAIIQDSNNNKSICAYNSNTAKWFCLYADITNISGSIPNFTQINPSITSAQNNTNCKNKGGYLVALNNNTFYYYNQNINNSKHINCLYYFTSTPATGTTQSLNLNCLQLPILVLSTTTTYDKLRLLCANDQVILAMGCANILYYMPLVNGIPTSENKWYPFQCPVDNSTVFYMGINDSTAFLYSYTNGNASQTKIMYSSIEINNNNLTTNWKTWISANSLNSISPNTPNPLANMLLNLTVNNNVMWAIDSGDSNGAVSLWWCPLQNGLPYVSNTNNTHIWKQIPYSGNNGINTIVNYNNQLIIYVNSNQNIIIPLYNSNNNPSPIGTTGFGMGGSGGGSSSGTNTTASSSGTNTTASSSGTNTTLAAGGSGGTNTTLAAGGSGSSSGGGTNTTLAAGGSGSGGGGSGGRTNTTLAAGGSGSGSGSGGSGSGSGGSGSGSGSGGSGSGGSGSGSGGSGGSGGGTNTTMANATESNGANGSTNIIPGLQGIAGLSGLNGFELNNNLFGNNLYTSPMNNQQLYNPNQNTSSKITSNFFPMVRIA